MADNWRTGCGLDLPLVLWLLLLALPLGMGWTLLLDAQAFVRDLRLWLRL